MTNNTTTRLSLEARVALETKRTERDTHIARLNSARASQKADGADEFRREVEINMEAIRLMNDEGLPPYLANRRAEATFNARYSLTGARA